MSEDRTLLWEVGCEELPAWACDAIERQLPALVRDALVDARLNVTDSDDVPVVWVGPRRFSVVVEALPVQPELRQRIDGPPLKIAFEGGDPSAAPSRAAIGFAEKNEFAVTELQVDAERGTVYVERELPEVPIEDVWPALAESILGKLQFAKPMRWGNSPWRFVRPIRWMVTIHGGHVLEYDCWGVKSGRETRTHRFLGAERTTDIIEADTYAATLRSTKVIVDQNVRRTLIETELATAASEFGGEYEDPGNVLKEVVHLVEQPSVITGRFDEKYLELPERVLVTAMQSHQRYLPIKTSGGDLAPAFLTVMNADPAAVESIRPGYERVLEGRLDDAVFSFDRDRSRGLDDMATDASLGAVVFHAKAGSLADRRDRITKVATALAAQLGVDAAKVADAARLAKADQVSTVVQEFAELEGYVGSLYAKSAGYDDAVCAAIDWQFAPRGADAPLPPAGVAAVIALADKIELLVTMFAIGEMPTGSRDPHGLRRAAIGVMRIALEHDLPLELDAAIDAAWTAIDAQGYATNGETPTVVREFILDRVEKRLSDDGVRVDAVRAARAAGLPQLQHLDELARALDIEVKGGNATFAAVLEAQDRSRKLLAKAGGTPDGSIDPAKFEVDSERELHRILGVTSQPLRTAVAERRFGDAVSLAAGLGPVVESFFSKESGVMIMTDDDMVRDNRLLLLGEVLDATSPLGDLSQLQV
jgi:glycyl-tRNA synthetase beta chain